MEHVKKPVPLAVRMRAWIHLRHQTQRELARLTGIHEATISRLLAGLQGTPEQIEAIEEVIDA